MTRENVVHSLMQAANACMSHACDTLHASPEEVLSAYITMARNVVVVVRERGTGDMDVVRAAVEQILLECPPRGQVM